MSQLDEFCHEYLPQYFVMKYNEGNIKREFFEYKNPNNVFELTAKIFSLIDQLHAANPQLQPTKIVDTYFSFRFSDFLEVYQENQFRDEKSEDPVIESIRKILKKMKDHHRECFQLFIRLIYLYFDSKEKQNKSDLKKKQNQKEYFQSLSSLYKDLRLKTEMNDRSLVPSHFMEYAIDLLLNMRPNGKFIEKIAKLVKQCEFPEIILEKIYNTIKNIQQKPKLQMIINPQNIKIEHTEKSQSGKNSSLDSQTKLDSNQGTPVKEESPQKNQRKTLQTSQKKYNMVFKNPQQDRFTLDSLKTSLMLQRKPSTISKQRTIYNCTKYLVPKKTLLTPPVNTSASIGNYIQEMRFSELNRSFRTRLLEATSCEDEGFLAGATPKLKKKLKTENGLIRPPFDQKGNFIYKN